MMFISPQSSDIELYKESYRPQFHYSPPRMWMNDPNGLVYYEGEYHLFYQYHPESLVWGPMHWGHAVSPDLIHWQTLPIALYPDALGTIFSGTVVIDHENTSGLVPGGGMVAIFSYDTQTQGVAYSQDRGRTWTKYVHNPVMPALAKDFRDPKIFWHSPSAEWIMAIAAGLEIQFFTSPDLLNWLLVSTFTGGDRAGVWEVPDLFPLELDGDTYWILLVSVDKGAVAGGSGTQYFIGDFDGRRFTNHFPDQTLWLDYGPDNYAGTLFNNALDNQKLFIAWMSNWKYARVTPTTPWRGAMTLPRTLFLKRTGVGLRLAQTPLTTLNTLRQPIGEWDNMALDGALRLPNLSGQCLEIIAEFEAGSAAQFGVQVLQNDQGNATLYYDVAAQMIHLTRSPLPIEEFTTAFSASLAAHDGRIRLHIFVDRSSVEVFANEGEATLTAQVFADPAGDQVTLFARGGSARLIHLEAYQLKSIWA